MKCKLTGTEGKGVRAHIIPKSFYALDQEEKQPFRLITNIKGHYSQKCPIGIYDTTMVTEEGERIFSEWDDYAKELLLDNKSSFESVVHDGEVIAFQIAEYDYPKLKLFFLSVLWRASASSHNYFRRVDLGPLETSLRNALLAGNPGDSDWFSICLAKWSDRPDGTGMMDPYRTRIGGLNYYVLYLKHYIVYFKVDRRIASGALRALQLRPDSPLIAVGRELNSSKELKIMSRMVKDDVSKMGK